MSDPAPSNPRPAADLLVRSAAPAGDPLAELRGTFEQLAVRCTERLGELAPAPMELSFRDIASGPMGDANTACGESSLVGVFQTPDKSGRVLVGADTAFLNAAIEAVLGSDGTEPAGAERAATRIGLRLAGTIFQQIVDELRPSVLGSKSAALELDKVDTAAKLPAPARWDEPSVTARFGLSTLGRPGELFRVLPQSAIQGAEPASARATAGGAPPGAGDTGWSRRIEQEVHRTEVTLHAVLDERELTLGEIAGLRIGQVLPLKATPRSNVRVVCNDQTMFWCELGQAEGVYTLRIKEFPDQERELLDAITSR